MRILREFPCLFLYSKYSIIDLVNFIRLISNMKILCYTEYIVIPCIGNFGILFREDEKKSVVLVSLLGLLGYRFTNCGAYYVIEFFLDAFPFCHG